MKDPMGLVRRLPSIQSRLLLLSLLLLMVFKGQAETLSQDERALLESEWGTPLQAVETAPDLDDNLLTWVAPDGGARTYQVWEVRSRPKQEVQIFLNRSKENSENQWEYRMNGDESQILEETPEGHLVILGATDKHEGVSTRFEPPKPLLKLHSTIHETTHQKYAILVYDLKNPEQLKHSGSMEAQITPLGAFKITVPAGTFEGLLVRSIAKGEVGPAKLEDTQYRLYARETGLIAALEQRKVSAFKIYQSTNKTVRVLSKPGR